jgi:two-component system response regulator AtoC
VLTDLFLRQYAEHYNKPLLTVGADTRRLFTEYDWPGNVRELENAIKRMVILGTETPVAQELSESINGRKAAMGPIPALEARSQVAEPAAAAVAVPTPPPAPPAAAAAAVSGSLKDLARHAAREAEREIIIRTLQQTRWNRREAAELLGVSYKALLYKIKEAELDRAS